MPETGIRYDQHQRIIDGNGKILVTNPSDPATGGYVTENQLKEWIGKGVVAVDSSSSLPSVGDGNILYIVRDTNTLYRWTGSGYVVVSDTSGLAEKSYVDDQLALKANAETTYTKNEVDALVEQAKPADYDEVKERVSTLEAENAQQAKDIAMLKYANEGKTYIMEESDRDGYSVDVKPATVTGEAFGEAVLKSMEGRDVVWNQLNRLGLVSVPSAGWEELTSYFTVTSNHVYIVIPTGTVAGRNPEFRVWNEWDGISVNQPLDAQYAFKVQTSSNRFIVRSITANGSSVRMFITDLTTMFGISEVSQVTDAMKAQVRAYLADHPEYNEGTIVNNAVTEVRSEGANLAELEGHAWNSQTGLAETSPDGFRSKNFIPVEDGQTYYFGFEDGSIRFDVCGITEFDSSYTRLRYSHYSGNYGYYRVYTVSSDAKYVKFTVWKEGTRWATNIPRFMMVAGSAKKPYTPYRPPVTLSLPSICSSLHGVGTARDKVGFVNRVYENMKAVDLGTLDWEYDASTQRFSSTGLAGQYVPPINGLTPANAISNAIPVVSNGDVYDHKVDLGLSLHESNGKVWIYDKSKVGVSASAFKASLSGVILHYESTSGGQRYEARVLERKVSVLDKTSLGSLNNASIGSVNAVVRYNLVKPSTVVGSGDFRGAVSDVFREVDAYSASSFSTVTESASYSWSMSITSDGTRIAFIIPISVASSVDSAKAWVESNAWNVIYPLATPQLLDVTSEVPEEPSIAIEDGGTLTFVNENKVATPFTMSMPVKLGGTV